jgi:hypothetical protein
MDILTHLQRIETEYNSVFGVVHCSCTTNRTAGAHRASINAELRFFDNSVLFLKENVDSTQCFPDVRKYSYQYMRNDELIFRYDNAPHHQELATFPHHKHISEDSVTNSVRPSHKDLFHEVSGYLPSA